MILLENRLPADDLMKYHALFVIFKKVANFQLSSAANYRWRFKGKYQNQIIQTGKACVNKKVPEQAYQISSAKYSLVIRMDKHGSSTERFSIKRVMVRKSSKNQVGGIMKMNTCI